MKKIGKTKPIQPQDADHYFKKAQEFFYSMKLEAEFKNWNTVGLCGVHCAISASDALLAKFAKVRNVSQNHYDSVTLIRQHIGHSDTKIQSNRLERIIKTKNIVEYMGDPFTEKQAQAVLVDVERYFSWVKELF